MEWAIGRRSYRTASPCQNTYVDAVNRFRGAVGATVGWNRSPEKYAPFARIRAGPRCCALLRVFKLWFPRPWDARRDNAAVRRLTYARGPLESDDTRSRYHSYRSAQRDSRGQEIDG